MTFQNNTASTAPGQVFSALNRTRHYTRVDPVRNRLDDWNDEKQTRPPKGAETAEPQHHDALPLINDLDGLGDNPRGDQGDARVQRASHLFGEGKARIGRG